LDAFCLQDPLATEEDAVAVGVEFPHSLQPRTANLRGNGSQSAPRRSLLFYRLLLQF